MVHEELNVGEQLETLMGDLQERARPDASAHGRPTGGGC